MDLRNILTYFDVVPNDIVITIYYILLDQHFSHEYTNFYEFYSQFDMLSSDIIMKNYLKLAYPQLYEIIVDDEDIIIYLYSQQYLRTQSYINKYYFIVSCLRSVVRYISENIIPEKGKYAELFYIESVYYRYLLKKSYPYIYNIYKELYNVYFIEYKIDIYWKDIYNWYVSRHKFIKNPVELDDYESLFVGDQKNLLFDTYILTGELTQDIQFVKFSEGGHVGRNIMLFVVFYLVMKDKINIKIQNERSLYEIVHYIFPYKKSNLEIIMYNSVIDKICKIEYVKLRLISYLSKFDISSYPISNSEQIFLKNICRKLGII